MLAYLEAYARHHKLNDHIIFNSPVAAVKLAVSPEEARANPVQSEMWAVHLKDGSVRRYAGVIVAIGHHWDCRFAGPYPGEKAFAGEVIHSKRPDSEERRDTRGRQEIERDLTRPPTAVLRGKRVLVIGGGNSACDVAVEAARFGAESHISLKTGVWFLPRTVRTVSFAAP
jgi:cation diffusion facilitator CzcD-associated flavoprotein CzcO